jgi:ABC-2 type transport system permease protein
MNNWNLPWKNPVLIKDFRTRMRGNRAFILLSIHLFIIAVISILAYLSLKTSISYSNPIDNRTYSGKAIFGLILSLELIMVSFVAPALTASSISSERENQTYELLRATLLPASRLVLGKFTSGFIFLLLLLFTSIPLQAPAFIFGGVLLEEIIIGTLILVMAAFGFCAVGIFLSSRLRRSLTTTVLSYTITMLLVFGIPIFLLAALVIFGVSFESILDDLSPITEFSLLLLAWFLISFSPSGVIFLSEFLFIDQESIFLASVDLPSGPEILLPYPWILFCLIYLFLGILLLRNSIHRTKMLDK